MAEAILASNLHIGSNSLDAYLSFKDKQIACALRADDLAAACRYLDEMYDALVDETVKSAR